jgi:polyhydroxyalkanoate synthesis regulator phasin
MMRKISKADFEELYMNLMENLTRHAYESIMQLLDELEDMVEDGRLNQDVFNLLVDLLQSLSRLISSRDEVEEGDKREVDEAIAEGFRAISETIGEDSDLIEDAAEILMEIYDAKELLDKVQRRIVSLLDSLQAFREITGSGIRGF